ncbi:hypothetical protein BXZ70DRAFT_931611 [Cristinia sonorae]|uniref:Uncharacterized protein n=1 Tax=Cristinia sonorae TaxID=1940300 RepID=A0A8K0UPT2_9AGAR|nr:hypothetical protein BXZ70DRAFT_931611 [Cristinia sonorae]
MPVTIKSSLRGPKPVSGALPLSSEKFLAGVVRKKQGEILQTSFPSNTPVLPMKNGFVDTVMKAYSYHHNLVLRPDDVWIAILSQFSSYVNANAEELQSSFVQHEGQKSLDINLFGTRHTVDFGEFAKMMSAKIDDDIVDKSLKDWILPNFSTTTDNDTTVCAIMMMATLQKFYTYSASMWCGIPFVTLEGKKSDWDLILSRLDKLATFGEEPTAFAQLLRPILTRFSQAFTNARKGLRQDMDFWTRVVNVAPEGSGSTVLSGWITAFCSWSTTGRWMGPELPLKHTEVASYQRLALDGVEYSGIDIQYVPLGYCEVDVKVNDHGLEFDCAMAAGHMGASVEGEKSNTLRPLSSWFMYVQEGQSGRTEQA